MAQVSAVYLPTIWAQESLMILTDTLVMAGLVHRDFEPVVANVGDRVRTRLPRLLTAHVWTNQAGTNAEATEDKRLEIPNADNLTVVLDTIGYTAMLIQDAPQTMSMKSFREEFAVPLMQPLSQQIDDSIMTEFTSPASTDVLGLPVDVIASGAVGAGAALTELDLIEADLQLNNDRAPRSPRWLVLSSAHNADLLGRSLFHQANTAGETAALRDAIIGRAFGFTVLMSQNVPSAVDSDGTAQSIAFHRNSLALVTRLLDLEGANQNGARAARADIDNVSIRITTQYHQLKNGVGVVGESLYGVQLMDNRMAKIINP